jgi:hypothetical protein
LLTWGDWYLEPAKDGFTARRYAHSAAHTVRYFRSIHRFSLLNEPDLSLRDVSHRSSVYRRIFRLSYRAIHHARRHIQVLLGETSPYAAKGFLQRTLCLTHATRKRCRGMHADGYAHHPYQFRGGTAIRRSTPGDITDTPWLLRRLRHSPIRTRHGHRLPLYYTEFGYWGPDCTSSAANWPLAIRIAKRYHVRQLLAYQLVWNWGWWDTALVNTDGVPRPAFYTIRGAVRGVRMARTSSERSKCNAPPSGSAAGGPVPTPSPPTSYHGPGV